MDKVDGYTFICSSGISDKDRETREKNKNTGRGKGKSKGKGKGKRKRTDIDRSIGHEYHGVGIAYSPKAFSANKDYEQLGSRHMYTIQHTTFEPLCIINGYAPQSQKSIEEKEAFYNKIEEPINKFNSSHIVMCMGDFNARLHYRLESEKDVIGPYIFGKGEDYSNQQSNNTIESREQFVQFCLGNGMIL